MAKKHKMKGFLKGSSRTKNENRTLKRPPDDVVQHVRAHVKSVVPTKVGELEGRLSWLLSSCAMEASVRNESDALMELWLVLRYG